TYISADWYWETDTEHRFVMGVDKEGLWGKYMIGKHMWDFPSIDLSEEEWVAHRKMIASRQPVRVFEYRVIFPDGSERWFCTSADTSRDSIGRFWGYRGTTRGHADHKQASMALKASEENIRRLLEHKENASAEDPKRIAREIHVHLE